MSWQQAERRAFLSRIYEYKRQRRYSEMEEEVETALERFSGDPVLEVLLADVYWLQGKKDRARTLLAQLEVRGSELAEYHALRGTISLTDRSYRQALESFRQAEALRPSDFYRKRQADCLIHLGQFEEALALLRNLMRDRVDPFVLGGMARAYEGLQNLEDARACYEKILDSNPNDSFAKSRILRLKVQEKSAGSADREMERALRLPSQKSDPSMLKVRAEQLKKESRFAEASAVYERLIEVASEKERAYFSRLLAFCHYQGHEFDKAYPLLLEQFQQNPSDPYLRSSLISSARRLNRLPELVEELFSLAQNPSNHFLFGICKKLKNEISPPRTAPKEKD